MDWDGKQSQNFFKKPPSGCKVKFPLIPLLSEQLLFQLTGQLGHQPKLRGNFISVKRRRPGKKLPPTLDFELLAKTFTGLKQFQLAGLAFAEIK